MAVRSVKTVWLPARDSASLRDGEAKTRVDEGRFRNINLSFSLLCLLLKLDSSPCEANPRRQLSVLDIWQLSCALALIHLLHPQPSPARNFLRPSITDASVLHGSVFLQSSPRDMKGRRMLWGKCSWGRGGKVWRDALCTQKVGWLWCFTSLRSYFTFLSLWSDPIHLSSLKWQDRNSDL